MDETFDSVAQAALAAVNGWPELGEGRRFAFAFLPEEGGLALFPAEGSLLEAQTRSVTGRVWQRRRLPFRLVCRVGGLTETRRQTLAAWLERLGRYLQTADYPVLSGMRRLLTIQPAAAPRPEEYQNDNSETWVMDMTAQYEIIF